MSYGQQALTRVKRNNTVRSGDGEHDDVGYDDTYGFESSTSFSDVIWWIFVITLASLICCYCAMDTGTGASAARPHGTGYGGGGGGGAAPPPPGPGYGPGCTPNPTSTSTSTSSWYNSFWTGLGAGYLLNSLFSNSGRTRTQYTGPSSSYGHSSWSSRSSSSFGGGGMRSSSGFASTKRR